MLVSRFLLTTLACDLGTVLGFIMLITCLDNVDLGGASYVCA